MISRNQWSPETVLAIRYGVGIGPIRDFRFRRYAVCLFRRLLSLHPLTSGSIPDAMKVLASRELVRERQWFWRLLENAVESRVVKGAGLPFVVSGNGELQQVP